MAASGSAVERAGRAARKAVHHASPWLERAARAGYATKAAIYLIVGVLALEVALHNGGRITDGKGALLVILRQPLGNLLLGLTAAGLAAYALWRIVQAVADPEHRGSDSKDVIKRIAFFASGLAYGGFAYTAVKILAAGDDDDRQGASRRWTGQLLNHSFGPTVVVLAGLLVIGIGCGQTYGAFITDFGKRLKWGEMSEQERFLARAIGRFGIAARGVVFALVGFFIVQAGRHSNPREAGGLVVALLAVVQAPYGASLLAVAAAGMIAYGVYELVEARYRDIPV